MGNKIHEKVVDVLSEYQFIWDDELIWCEEIDQEEEYKLVESASSSPSDEYEPIEKRLKEDPEYIPLDYKIKLKTLSRKYKIALISLNKKEK